MSIDVEEVSLYVVIAVALIAVVWALWPAFAKKKVVEPIAEEVPAPAPVSAPEPVVEVVEAAPPAPEPVPTPEPEFAPAVVIAKKEPVKKVTSKKAPLKKGKKK